MVAALPLEPYPYPIFLLVIFQLWSLEFLPRVGPQTLIILPMPHHTDWIILGVVGLGTPIRKQAHNNMLSLLFEMGSC
jgi:hypothetical protein